MALHASGYDEISTLTFIAHALLNLFSGSLRLNSLLKSLPVMLTGVVVFNATLLFTSSSFGNFIFCSLSYCGEVHL